jgi:hypothetical protein
MSLLKLLKPFLDEHVSLPNEEFIAYEPHKLIEPTCVVHIPIEFL